MHAGALSLAFPPLVPGYPHVSHMSLVSLACLFCLLVLPPLAPSPFHAPPSAPAQHPSATPCSRPLPPSGLYSNYLTGTMPIPSTSLVALDVGFNFLSGSFPKLSLAVCAADQNCFLNSSYCRTYGSMQRPASACGICGTTNGQGTLCSGGLCSANSSLPVSQGIVNTPSVPLVSLTCSALLSLKASLGLTFTSWAASVPCQVVGKQAAAQPTWSGVLCSDAGDVFSISVARQNLTGSIDSDISKLTALTYLDFGYNLFQFGLTGFATPIKDMTSLKALFFNNWFSGTIPSFIASLPQLTTLGLFSNYFTGTMPTLSTSLVALDVSFNFLSGSFPQLSLKSCAADQNCFLNSSYCRTYGALQRLSSACAICGTTNGQGTLCSGGMCFADSLPVSQGIVNVPSLPPVALTCPGNAPLVLMNAGSALLSLKASLGVTFTSWAASVPCQVVGKQAAGLPTWSGVLCGDIGDVIYM
ncbi:unnamed protein product [Closterium sp. Naga37s-1]|nr:unnamed protein product [Closterium sp. Naga37s-1]